MTDQVNDNQFSTVIHGKENSIVSDAELEQAFPAFALESIQPGVVDVFSKPLDPVQ